MKTQLNRFAGHRASRACASRTLTTLASLPLAVAAPSITGTGSIPAWLRSRTGHAARLLLLLLCTLPATVQAQFTYTTNNGTITITKYTGSGGAVTIPDTIDSMPVTSIGHIAFLRCTSLTSVTIPNSVTSIGNSAFEGCSSLNNVTIPNSVTSIGERTFAWCTSLTAITVDTNNPVFSSVDGVLFDKSTNTLIQCPGGKAGSYTIPNSVRSIYDGAFANCTSLTSMTIGTNVTSIGDQAFCNCTSLTNVTIGNSVTSIGEYAFHGCTRLIAITVGPLNTAYSSLDGVLFNKSQTVLIQCPEGKAGSYTIPDSVTRIGNSAFEGCSSLNNVTIPNSVTSIGGSAFSYCTSLTIVVIPKPQLDAHPLVKEMLQDIQPTDLYSMMRQITGEEPVFVGNEVVVFTNRLTGSAPFRKATQFAFEQLQALGLQVQYQDWEVPAEGCADRNIIGIQPGVSRLEEIVVICAHFDDFSETNRAPGADDNGSGSAAVLTAARICSRYRFERTIHYVLFTGEEQYGLGSQEYVSQAVAGGSNIVAVLAPDMIGYASAALDPPTCGLIIPRPPDLGLEGEIGSEIETMFTVGFEIEAMFTNVVAVYGLSNTLSCSLGYPSPWWGIPSDAEFFLENGYPTLFLTHAHENSRIHSDEDTLDALNFSYFTAMVQAIVGTAAHLAYPVDRNPFEVIEVVNSDWTPASDLGGGHFYATFAFGASETNVDLQDLPWSEAATNSPFNKELRIYSDPYGVPLQIDTRPPGSDTLFRVKLAVADATTAGVSGTTRLRFSPLTPTGSNRIYLARVHVDGRYLVTGKDFDCVTNLHEVVSAGGFLDLPSLVQVPDGAVYGTCDIAARFVNTEPTGCRLRITRASEGSGALTATAQLGAHIVDNLEVRTNLASGSEWKLVKSYTNYVSPDAAHFDAGWTEIARECDPWVLTASDSYYFRLKRTWINPR